MPRTILWLALVALGGCRNAPSSSCSDDGDCPVPGTRCETTTGACICITSEACPEGAFCNGAGICQERAGCARTSECGAGTYCDVSTGVCLVGPPALGQPCGLASHCPYGSVCDGGLCRAGCFDSGDCPLGHVCQSGTCIEGICADDSFCEFGERCVQSRCQPDRRGPYCRGCSMDNNAQVTPCDEPRNFCLVNNFERGGSPTICGVDCSLGQPCPNGYECNNVLTLSGDACTFNAQCKCDPRTIRFSQIRCDVAAPCDPRLPDGGPDPDASGCTFEDHPSCSGEACLVLKGAQEGSCSCIRDDQCEGDSVCVDGVCCSGAVEEDRQCIVGEGRTSGFCNCATDDDCPQDVCNGLTRTCTFTQQACTPGEGDCGAISCVSGACLIGANCAPIQGLSCGDVNPR